VHCRGKRSFRDIGECRPGLHAVEGTTQQLNPDLKLSFTGPAPQLIQRIFEIAHARHNLIEFGGKSGEVRQRRKKTLRQDRVEESGVLRQALGQPRSPRHDLGDERQKAGIGVKQREQLHPGGQVRQELVEPVQRRIGVRGAAKYSQQFGYEFGQDFPRALASGGAQPAVMPASHQRGLPCGHRPRRVLGG